MGLLTEGFPDLLGVEDVGQNAGLGEDLGGHVALYCRFRA